MGKRLQETVELRRNDNGIFMPDSIEDILHRFPAVRVVIVMQMHVGKGKFDLTQHLESGLVILCRDHFVEKRFRQRLFRFDMGTHVLDDIPFPAEIFHELRR